MRAPGSEGPPPWGMSLASRGPEAAQDSPPPLPRGARRRAHTPGDGTAGAQEVPGPPRAPPPRRGGPLERRRAPGGRAGGGRAVTTRRCGAARRPGRGEEAGRCVASPVTLGPFRERLDGGMRPPSRSEAGLAHKERSCPARAPRAKKGHCPGRRARQAVHAPVPAPRRRGAAFRPVRSD